MHLGIRFGLLYIFWNESVLNDWLNECNLHVNRIQGHTSACFTYRTFHFELKRSQTGWTMLEAAHNDTIIGKTPIGRDIPTPWPQQQPRPPPLQRAQSRVFAAFRSYDFLHVTFDKTTCKQSIDRAPCANRTEPMNRTQHPKNIMTHTLTIRLPSAPPRCPTVFHADQKPDMPGDGPSRLFALAREASNDLSSIQDFKSCQNWYFSYLLIFNETLVEQSACCGLDLCSRPSQADVGLNTRDLAPQSSMPLPWIRGDRSRNNLNATQGEQFDLLFLNDRTTVSTNQRTRQNLQYPEQSVPDPCTVS